jgi:hypothetical protein
MHQLISYGAGHTSEIQLIKNQYVRNTGLACCILSHVPSCWPKGYDRLRRRFRCEGRGSASDVVDHMESDWSMSSCP